MAEHNKALAKYTAANFEGKPAVKRFWDDAEKFSIDVLHCDETPQPGMRSYATIGWSDYPFKEVAGLPVGLEILGACPQSLSEFPNALVSVVFHSLRSGWKCGPASILENALSQYEISPALKHFLFVPQYLWDSAAFGSQQFGSKTVAWLLAVPITDDERAFATVKGVEALQDLFEANEMDILDFGRKGLSLSNQA